ncbi:Putative threonine efflux protein [Rubellimicrobium thermophilum DSM 16684]|uniref:Putative threonine efflux protein n=1 Tax=Rubellimicrobium thermophilum DSM 16684 TaxID=1123069 RepID=S9R3Q7_9RHOB|nr:LysE family translocator [Rubellimicrobium thermophilum]EPX86593.1 Putative threonine efflux protein [Rubellimicrobium thermophilum DSM 16684]
MNALPFLPDWPVLLAFTMAGFVLFVTPGPDMSLWIARTLQGGRRAGLAAMMGTSAGCVIHSALAAGGISVLIAASPVAFALLKAAGACYLLWLAWQTLRHGSALQIEGRRSPASLALWPSFVTGLVTNLANPKVVLFFITFLPAFVSASDPHAGAKLLFLGLYFVALNFVLSAALILGADRLVGHLRRHPGILRWIDRLFAGVFGVFAIAILRTQARG